MNWAVFLGAFAGSLIELVEILAVVLVVGNVAGWRNALMGFGTYWLGEGLGYEWPTGGWSVLWLPLLWGLLMAAAAAMLRLREKTERSP